MDCFQSALIRFKSELLDQQLQQVLQARPHSGAADRQVQLAQLAAVVRVVPGQQRGDRAALGVDVPMAARRSVHVAVEVEAQKRKAVDPQLELGLGHSWIPVGRVRDEPDQDEQLGDLATLVQQRNCLGLPRLRRTQLDGEGETRRRDCDLAQFPRPADGALPAAEPGTVRRLTKGRHHGHGCMSRKGRGLIDMAKHGDKSTDNGQGNYDPTKSKDVKDAGGGRHSSEDKGDRDAKGDDEGKK